MYDEIVEFAELERFMDQKLKNYSSGMQVRLAFSIAIRADTDILVLDEVLAVGDANFQKKCFNYFRQLKDLKKTVILVSHDMESVRKFANRALMLESGEIKMIGSPDDVGDEYIKSNIDVQRTDKGAANDALTLDDDIERDVYISDVHIENSDGVTRESVRTKEDIAFVISYNNKAYVQRINFGIGVYSDDGGYVFGYNTAMDDFSKDYKGTGSVRLSLPSLPLLTGEYFVNVVCFGEDEADSYHFLHKVLQFSVFSTGVEKRYRGAVSLEHKWYE